MCSSSTHLWFHIFWGSEIQRWQSWISSGSHDGTEIQGSWSGIWFLMRIQGILSSTVVDRIHLHPVGEIGFYFPVSYSSGTFSATGDCSLAHLKGTSKYEWYSPSRPPHACFSEFLSCNQLKKTLCFYSIHIVRSGLPKQSILFIYGHITCHSGS